MPRLYRQAPLNSIWEGSGNIQCLDVLRALGREPDSADALFAEFDAVRGAHPRLDDEVRGLRARLAAGPAEGDARDLAGRLATALQASTLSRGDPDIAAAFIAARLGGRRPGAYGVLAGGAPVTRLLDRVLP